MLTPAALFLTALDGTPRRPIPAFPGSTVSVSVWYFSPKSDALGIDYRLTAPAPITLAGRHSELFTDTIADAPTIADDLGAVSADLSATGPGVFRVAVLDVTVAQGTPPGLYRLDLADYGGLVGPGFTDLPWNDREGIALAVGAGSIPEPAGLAALLGVGLMARRRRGLRR